MDSVLKKLGWVLIAAAAVVVAYPFFKASMDFDPLINALPAGVLVALGAQLLAQANNFSDAKEKRSLFYLDSCVKAYEGARVLLEDGNNERVEWIAAGRALVHAKELAESVTEDSHRRVLELHKLKYRGFFSSVISDKPAAFFYGAKDTAISIDDAAKNSTVAEHRGDRITTSTLNSLSDKSLHAVWEAAQWPTGYLDPLDRRFSKVEQAKLIVLFPGLHEFLEHKEQWGSVSGKLSPKKK
ncbi:MAG: hypothetical protein ABIU96_07115 [Rhodanobacter sp.]